MCNCADNNHPTWSCGSEGCHCHDAQMMQPSDDFVYMSITFSHVRREQTAHIYETAMRAAGTVDASLSVFKSIDEEPVEEERTFQQDLQHVLNRHSMENASGTPDYLLAEYLENCLVLFNETLLHRSRWRGESLELPALQELRRTTQR